MLTLRLELLPLRLCATFLDFRCLAQHVTYKLIYINEGMLLR